MTDLVDEVIKRLAAIEVAKANGTYISPISWFELTQHVYVARGVKWGKHVTKVGISSDVAARIYQIRQGDCANLVLKKQWKVGKDAARVERMVKDRLAHRLHWGEYFQVSLKLMISTVEQAIADVK